jgi:hypothetical protein
MNTQGHMRNAHITLIGKTGGKSSLGSLRLITNRSSKNVKA